MDLDTHHILSVVRFKERRRNRIRAICCLAGVLAVACGIVLTPNLQSWLQKRALLAKLKEDVNEWNEWRERGRYRRIDLSGVDLRGVDLADDLAGSEFSDTDPTRVVLDLAELSVHGEELRGADLSSVKFAGANLSMTSLFEANLSGADLRGANLSQAYLSAADLRDANLGEANCHQAHLEMARLTGAVLEDANLSGASFSEANLSGANLNGANLSAANLSAANLEGVNDWMSVRSYRHANVYRVKNGPEGFVEFAKKNGAVELDQYSWWTFLSLVESDRTECTKLRDDEKAEFLKAKEALMRSGLYP